MGISVSHAFVSAITDDPAAVTAGEVVPSNWNAPHTVVLNLGTYNVQDYGWLPDGTDRSTQALALLATVAAAGGGTLFFPGSTGTYRADSQLLIPNNSATVPEQTNIRFTGAGGGQMWGDETILPNVQRGAAVLDLRYVPGTQNGNAKIETRGSGSLVIDNLTLMDGGTSNPTPFIHTTNTTLTIRQNNFLGSGSATQDAIVLGCPSTQTSDGTVDSCFQGYGTIIDSNNFRNLNRGVYGRTFSNSVVVTNNAWLNSTGTRAIEFAATTAQGADVISGLYVVGNIIEMKIPMLYGVVLQGVQNSFFANSFYDPSVGTYISDYRYVVGSIGFCFGNTIMVMLSGGNMVTQSGLVAQLAANNYIGSGNTTNVFADGIASSFLAAGVEITGAWRPTNAAAGALNIRNQFAPDELLCLAATNTGTHFIDCWNNNGFQDALTLNPRGGWVQIYGPFALRPSALTLGNGLNSNITLYATGASAYSSYLRVTGPSAGFSIGGFSNRVSTVSTYPGSQLVIYNSTSQQMTIVNEDASSTATNRIKTLTGANVVLRAGTSAATFIYDDTDTRWVLLSTN